MGDLPGYTSGREPSRRLFCSSRDMLNIFCSLPYSVSAIDAHVAGLEHR